MKDEILDLIKTQKDTLTVEYENLKNNKTVIFLRKFFKENQLIGVDNLSSVDSMQLLLALTLILENINDDEKFKKINDAINSNRDLFQTLNSHHLMLVFAVLEEIVKLSDENKVVITEAKDNIEINIKDLSIKKMTRKCCSVLSATFEDPRIETSLISLLYLYKEHPQISRAKELVIAAIYLKEKVKFVNDSCQQLDDINSLSKSKDINGIYKELFKLDDMYKVIKEANDIANKTIHENEKECTKKLKEINNYISIEDFITKLNTDKEIIQIPSSIERIDDDNIRNQILRYIYTINMAHYNEVSKIYNNLSNHDKLDFKKVFSKYNIKSEKYLIDLSITPKELDDLLKELYKMDIKNEELIMSILTYSSKDTINTLYTHMNQGFISERFIKNNLDLFLEKTFKNYLENLTLLQENEFSVNNINRIEKSLVANTEIIKRNIRTLKDYDLFKTKLSNKIITSSNLEEKIDLLLENGYEDNLVEDISLLQYDLPKYKRLSLYQELEIPLLETSDVKKVLEKSDFPVSDIELADYINEVRLDNDDSEFIEKQKVVDFLEEHKSSDRTYNVDGIIISKNKAKRLLNNEDILTLNKAYYLVFKGTAVSIEQKENIKKLDLNNIKK